MAWERRRSRAVKVRGVTIGGGAPVVVQGMTKTDTRDVKATVAQMVRMAEAGCELIRVAVPDRRAAQALREIVPQSPVPVVADIHFNYSLALMALEAGVDKLRLNPGNIGEPERVRQVVREAKARGVPIRIGVNAGSLEKPLLEKYGYPTAEAMVESARSHLRILEDLDFFDTVVSLKASDVVLMLTAYRMLATQVDYPLHLGVTEAGTPWTGTIRSAVGIGTLLAEGIGDTIRVSLSGEPEEEARVAREILSCLDLRVFGPKVISCPTCGRCQVDVISMAEAVERRTRHLTAPLRISVMGCAVNGPGECRGSDLGMAGGKAGGLLYRHGEVVRQVADTEMVEALVAEAEAQDRAWAQRQADGEPERR